MLKLETLADLLDQYRQAAGAVVREFKIGDRFLAFNTKPAIMGVINLSPDSWYRESVCLSADSAIQRGRMLRAQGADLIDVGAESSLAQAERSDERLQSSRLVPVVEALRQEGCLVSVETYQSSVAQACLKAGAQVLNLTGLEHGERIFSLVRDFDAAVILCHVQGAHVRAVGDFDFGADSTEMLYDYFARTTEEATRAGLEKIIIDPGLGFYYENLRDSSLRVRYQIRTFLNTFRLRTLGFPVCHALPHAFEYFGEEVRSAEPFFAVLAALGKTDLFRTHEVARVKAVLDTLETF
jgi:dihydropteroate synthase